MDTPSIKRLNAILLSGMALIFAGLILILFIAGTVPDVQVLLLPAVLFISGFVNLFLFMTNKRTPFRLFLSLALSLNGVFASFLAFGIFPVGADELWPVYIFITALSLFASGRFTGKRFALSYDLPALMLLALGILFLLYSFDVITVPFRTLALLACPGIMICAGVFLVVLFMHRKSLLDMLPEELSKEFSDDEKIEDGE